MKLAYTWREFIGRTNKDTLRLDGSLKKYFVWITVFGEVDYNSLWDSRLENEHW